MGAAAVPGRLDWIAVDWGTSALRAWALDAGGNVLAHAHSQDGMGTLSPDGYEPTLLRLAGGWLPAGKMRVPVIVCGMAGARQGWTEAAYRQIPCRPVAGRQMTPVATSDERLDVAIVPGLCQIDPPDVMRGEETQLAGLMRQTGTADAVVCMPGTHSKWVRVERGDVVGFTTFMTGELFAVISTHSILRHSVGTSGDDRDAFLQGVSDMHAETGTLTAALFGIRASGLLAGMAQETARSRLSGLLIGAELAATRTLWEAAPVHLVGAGPLVASYADALGHAGGTAIRHDAGELTLQGLAMARAAMKEAAA